MRINTYFGCKFHIDTSDLEELSLVNFGENFSTRERQFMRDNLHEDDLFVDIGANIGIYSCYANTLKADILAFEPNTYVYNKLLDNFRLNDIPPSCAWNLAISNKREVLPLYVPKMHGMASLIRHDGEPISVMCIPLHHAVTEHINMLKLDCEGYEKRILEDYLKYDIPDHIILEWNYNYDNAIDTCLSQGYEIVEEVKGGLFTNHLISQSR